MKKTIRIRYDANRTEEREINYIPVRYILALLLTVLETACGCTAAPQWNTSGTILKPPSPNASV